METITVLELTQLNGGSTTNLPCADALQIEAGNHLGDESYDWDGWAERYMNCVNGH